jgi:hypothetical protein
MPRSTRVNSGKYHIKVLTKDGDRKNILAEINPYYNKLKFEFWEDCTSKNLLIYSPVWLDRMAMNMLGNTSDKI